MMGNFYRICTKLNDKGKLVPEGTDFDKYKKGEAYVSAFKYNDKHVKQFKTTGTVAGIEDVETDIIYFDLDNVDLEEARKDTIKVVDKLKEYDILSEDLAICYTSSKGFHIALHTESSFSPKEARTLAINIAGNLPSFDSSIYNANRIIRLEGSVHQKTGLRKTRITEDELRSLKLAELKDLARSEYEYSKPKKQKLSAAIMKLSEVKEKEGDASIEVTDNVDYLSNPFKLEPRMLAASQGFFPNGNRSNVLIVLASKFKSKGLLKEQCYRLLKTAAELQANRYRSEQFPKEEIWNNIVEQVYGPNWKGGTYLEENYPTQVQNYYEDLGVPVKVFSDVVNSTSKLTEVFDDFSHYARLSKENTVETGITELDNVLKIRKGHMIGLIAPPSVGKTSFALTVLNNTSKKEMNSFMASYDMYKHNVISKLVQRESGDDEETIFQNFIDQDVNKIEEYKQLLKDNYGNVSFCFKHGQTVEELKKSIALEEEKLGEDIPLIVIDYLELIKTDKTDPTMSSAEAIQGLREIANDGKVVLVLLQPNKMSSKMNQPMMSYNAAKGSSAIAQACTAILGCWREGMSPDNPENDKFFSINILKNRNGSLASLDFAWDGPSQRITTLTAEQKFELSVLRDTKQDAEDDI